MTKLVAVYAIAFLLALTGCGKDDGTTVPTPNLAQTPAPKPLAQTPSPTATPTPTPVPPVSVTYYALTITLYLINGVTPVEGTAYCTVYSGSTYCWDDGLHGAQTYFDAENGLTFCRGGCIGDTFATPVLIDANVTTFNNNDLASRSINTVLTTGQFSTVSCIDDGVGNVVCPNFTIDTNQIPL